MKSIVVKLAMVALAVCAVAWSCDKDDSEETIVPNLTLGSITDLSFEAAGNQGTFTFTTNQDWVVSPNASWIKANPSSGKASDKVITVTVTCDPNTAYSARSAVILVKAGDLTKEITVAQAAAEQPATPLQAVDLGLSVLWADRNLGADGPTGYGDYYAWGETQTKDNYTWGTYKWSEGSKTTLTKYNTRSEYGKVDNDSQLDLEDDAAWVNTGGQWRMPTDAEITELRNACNIEWATVDGVGGCWFTSKTNGNKFFVPAAGGKLGTQAMSVNSHVNMVSANICSESNGYGYKDDYAWYLYFDDDERLYRYGDSRASGWAIRPVKDKVQ
ncbi:MAG: BACON domain-containing protein [Bacteroidales bacterium]|nr:BACON domain-containing protein [Bacteroidales bacterium]